MWRIFLTICLLCWSADGQVREVRCRNESDEPVDWYIMYKAPKLNNIGTKGLEYIYIDSNGKEGTSKSHNKLINNTNGVLANTLQPLFTTSMPADFGFITYNDQPPPDGNGGKPSVDSKFGHSKGVVMMDKTTGVWLSHSVPKFPSTRDKNNFYPPSGAAKAQTFICVTFNYDQFNKIGQHLLDIAAYPFDHHIPTDFYNELQEAAKKEWNNRIPEERIQHLTSAGGKGKGTQFCSIAKKLYKAPTTPAKGKRPREDIFGNKMLFSVTLSFYLLSTVKANDNRLKVQYITFLH